MGSDLNKIFAHKAWIQFALKVVEHFVVDLKLSVGDSRSQLIEGQLFGNELYVLVLVTKCQPLLKLT